MWREGTQTQLFWRSGRSPPKKVIIVFKIFKKFNFLVTGLLGDVVIVCGGRGHSCSGDPDRTPPKQVIIVFKIFKKFNALVTGLLGDVIVIVCGGRGHRHSCSRDPDRPPNKVIKVF